MVFCYSSEQTKTHSINTNRVEIHIVSITTQRLKQPNLSLTQTECLNGCLLVSPEQGLSQLGDGEKRELRVDFAECPV